MLLVIVALIMAAMMALSSAGPALAKKQEAGSNCGHNSTGFTTFSHRLGGAVVHHSCAP
jgi:hypothetical protein